MHAYVCLHVEASRRIVLVAVILGSGEGAPLGEPCRHGSFPTSSAGWLNVWGHLWREQRVRLGVGTLAPGVLLRITRIPWLQKSSGCLECPLKGQAGFEVRASFRLPELAQLHTCVPRVSSSLRPVPRVPPYMQPCALRRGLGPTTRQWPSPVSLLQSQGLKPWPHSGLSLFPPVAVTVWPFAVHETTLLLPANILSLSLEGVLC